MHSKCPPADMPRTLLSRRPRLLRSLIGHLMAGGFVFLSPPISYSQAALDLESVIRTTLDRSVSILEGAEATKVRAAELQVSEGAFDLVVGLSAEGARTSRLFSGDEQSVFNTSSAYTGISSYRLVAVRLTRSGITISPALQVSRQDALTLAAPPIIRTQAAFEISYPILNVGRRSPESAEVSSARNGLEASRYAERHTRSWSVYRAAVAYWSYAGAVESLDILNESEDKARRLLSETQALVDGGERAASDLDQLRADLADRFAARIAAEQRLIETRLHLGMEMGMGADEANALPLPSPELPYSSHSHGTIDVRDLQRLAASSRDDLTSIEYTVRAASDARHARAVEARPRLDLLASVGYAGLAEDRLTLGQHLPPIGQNHVNGANGSISLVFTWPTSNRRDIGRLERQSSVWRQARIARDNLSRQIQSGLQAAFSRLHSSKAELDRVDEAVDLYEASVENEKRRLQLGMSTQFDLILVEERLRNSLLARVAARIRYAEAIAALRFETGSLGANRLGPHEIAIRLLSPNIEIR